MMHEQQGVPEGRGHVNRLALLVLVLALTLVGVSAAQVVYRVLLPTDGWDFTNTLTVDQYGTTGLVVFTSNLLGTPSPLQAGDRLYNLAGVRFSDPSPRADGWQAGHVVRYTVVRAGQLVDLEVRLTSWTPGALLLYATRNAVQGLAALLALAFATLVLIRRPSEPAPKALLLFTAILTANALSGLVPTGPTTVYNSIFLLTAFFSYWIWGILLAPTLFVLSLVFPQPKRMLRRFPWLVVLPYLAFWVLVAIFGPQGQIGFGLSGVFFILTLISVVHAAFVFRDRVSRMQMLWGLGGLLGLVVCYLPFFLIAFGVIGGARVDQASLPFAFASLLSPFGFPVFQISLGIAILRYHLFDIELIIRRTLVYAVLTAVLAGIYFGGVVLLQALLQPLTGAGNDLAVVATTLLIAALFLPLRRRVQAFIDRRFYRRKYDAAQILAAFGERARDEVELDKLTGRLVEVVDETMQPAHIALWLAPARKETTRG